MRAFIALDVPYDVRSYLENITQILSKKEDDVRWVKGNNQHLTLKFLGKVNEEEKGKIIDVLTKLAENFPRINASLGKIDGFPKSRSARVIVVTLSSGIEELKKIFMTLEEELLSLGFKREEREFTPHITLGRRKNPKPLKEIVQIEPLKFVMEDLVLYKSTLCPWGPIYEPIWKSKLKKGGE